MAKQKFEDFDKKWASNPMLRPFIEKVVVNIGVGEGGEQLEKARRVLLEMTNHEPVLIPAKRSVKEWGIRKGQNIAVKVTLRGDEALKFLRRVLAVTDNRILNKSFDDKGNFSLGVDEHIKVPGMKYNPELGIFGFNLSVRLARPGFRVKIRKKDRRNIGKNHYVSREEAKYFVRNVIKAEIVDKIEERYY